MNKAKLRNRHPKQEDEEDEEEEEASILQLPHHIIVEIFCKLQIKALVQCRCVCKSWCHSITDPKFTKYLFSRTPTSILFIKPNSTGLFLFDVEKASSHDDVVMKLPIDVPILPTDIDIEDSCNGLLCLKDGVLTCTRLFISNPMTGESLALPTPKHEFRSLAWGFGFSPISDVYKLVVFMIPRAQLEFGYDKIEASVMTIGRGIWRSIENPGFLPLHQSSKVYLNRFIHWLHRCDKHSVSACAFGVESERFQQFPLPPSSLEDYYCRLGVLRGCLSLTDHSGDNVIVWVMKNYGIKESWTKQYEIRHGGTNTFNDQLLKATEEGQILLFLWNQLMAYTPRRGIVRVEVDETPSPVYRPRVYVHIPSFVSLKDAIKN